MIWYDEKGIALIVIGALTVGTLTGFAYAHSVKTIGNKISTIKVEENLQRRDAKEIYKDMIKIMKKMDIMT